MLQSAKCAGVYNCLQATQPLPTHRSAADLEPAHGPNPLARPAVGASGLGAVRAPVCVVRVRQRPPVLPQGGRRRGWSEHVDAGQLVASMSRVERRRRIVELSVAAVVSNGNGRSHSRSHGRTDEVCMCAGNNE